MALDFKTNFLIIIRLLIIGTILLKIKNNKVITIDNLINETYYQDNQDFSKFNQTHKIIALYYPYNNKSINRYYNLKNDINNSKLIEKQIELAKNHGIYGFGIIYDWLNIYSFNDTILNLFSYINKLNFSFFMVFNEQIRDAFDNNHLIKNWNMSYNEKNLFNFFDNIKHYFLSDNYIKYKRKPILGIFHSSYFSSDLIEDIRQYQIENGMNKFFIISIYNDNRNLLTKNSSKKKVIFPSTKLGLTNDLNLKYFYNHYYSLLFNQEINQKKNIISFKVVNGSPPNKFYNLLKKYLNEVCFYNEAFILINAWNNYNDNLYLEPNDEYGFSYLNYFSKAIFNLEEFIHFDFLLLINKCKIAVQVHLFYIDLIKDVINKTNNIPIKFDLYITIPSQNIFRFVDNYIKNYSKSNHYEILIVENKGRDVLPFLIQIKPLTRKYKYICHIHSKKSKTSPKLGFHWRNYLFNNLLGNNNIVSGILNDFEKNKKLGFIFPETFYGIIPLFYILTEKTRYWMDFLSSKLFPLSHIGELVYFPAGNMFWAKINAIFQIFALDLSEYFPKEDKQINDTIMHAIERIWLYLVKFNHFKYKIIFNIF